MSIHYLAGYCYVLPFFQWDCYDSGMHTKGIWKGVSWLFCLWVNIFFVMRHFHTLFQTLTSWLLAFCYLRYTLFCYQLLTAYFECLFWLLLKVQRFTLDSPLQIQWIRSSEIQEILLVNGCNTCKQNMRESGLLFIGRPINFIWSEFSATWIPDFRFLLLELDSRFQSPGFRIPQAKICYR